VVAEAGLDAAAVLMVVGQTVVAQAVMVMRVVW
jgi:hypothetical protein